MRRRPPRSETTIEPSLRNANANAPCSPSVSVSTSYFADFAGYGARVWPSHCGVGAYPSGAALASDAAPGVGAGGRGAGLIVMVCAAMAVAIAGTIRMLRSGFWFRIALMTREACHFAES